MSINFFYNLAHMKSTDTIIGAFGVLGIVLLAVFAFAGSTSDQEVNINTADTDTEEVLVDTTTSEEVLNPEVATETKEVVVSAENDEAILNLSDLSSRVSNIFPANPGSEAVVENDGSLTEVVVVEESNVPTQVVVDETVTVNEEVVVVDTAEGTESEQESVIAEDSSTDEPGRISRFFSNLFGGDDARDVGGNMEDDVDGKGLDISSEGNYVVQSGDNIWDILTINLGLTNGETATIINDMRADSDKASQFGVTSGSVDLIYVGQTLDFSVLQKGSV